MQRIADNNQFTLETELSALNTAISGELGALNTAISTQETELSTLDTELSTRISTQETELSTLSALSTAISGELGTLNTAISTQETELSTLDTELSTRISTQETELSTLSALNTAISGELGTLNTAISTQETELSTLDTELNAQISTLNTELGTINTAISTQETELSTLDTELNAQISTLNTELGTINTAISTQETELSTLSALNTAISGELGTLNTAISTQETELSTLDTELSTRISTQETELSTLSALNTAISGELGTLNTAISTQETELSTLDTELNAQISTLNTELGTINTAISTQETELSTLDTELNAQISTLNTELGTINTAISTLNTETGIQEFDVDINNSSYTDIFQFTQLHSSSSFIVSLATATPETPAAPGTTTAINYVSSVQLSVVVSHVGEIDIKQLASTMYSPLLIKITHGQDGDGIMSAMRFGGDPGNTNLRINVKTFNGNVSPTISDNLDTSADAYVYEKYFGYADDLDIGTPVRIWHYKSHQELLRRGYLPMVGAQYNISNLPAYYKTKLRILSTSGSGFSSVITEFNEEYNTVTTADRTGYYFTSTSDHTLIGRTEEDQIQNITASFKLRRHEDSNFLSSEHSGAFSSIEDADKAINAAAGTTNIALQKINFDASASLDASTGIYTRTGTYTRPKTMYVGGTPALYFLRNY